MFPFRNLAIIFTLFIVCVIASNNHLHPLSDEFVDLINSKQNLWTAGRNFQRNTSLRYIYRLMGTIKGNGLRDLPERRFYRPQKVPSQFDSRKRWPKCPTLSDIRDQGSCGSCWAVAAASAMTDRICIQSNGTKNFYFSADDILSCCSEEICGNCNGGKLDNAWRFYKRVGIVSGGPYNSTQGCRPYEIPPCEHDVSGGRAKCTDYVHTTTPRCKQKCNKHYKIKYNQDKHRAHKIYPVTNHIRKEIYKFGPVTSSFDVYEDFLNYKSGIYNYTTGKYIGGHSVKLIGWGKKKGIKYWIVANSWNTDWGENGFFKIIRGNNHCNIESAVAAGR